MNIHQKKAEKKIRKLIILVAKNYRLSNLLFLLPKFKVWLEKLYDFPSHSEDWVKKLLDEIETEIKKYE